MRTIHFDGANVRLKPPADWDAAKNGLCLTIYGLRDKERGTFATVWTFTDEERAAIAAGHNLVMSTVGGFPPTAMSVANVPETEEPSAS
ncbi:hypothetical protein [Methylorubrum extorquens]|uniref:hypothetical protein n=1 Tax=Methylorubrum extorquens TaxID=408 RepID=UPI0020A0F91A|nr:hypothetical protein [Methylorubrum extorquens]MCP1539972.1 hypothetical protein [Methylorubrum extorquens]